MVALYRHAGLHRAEFAEIGDVTGKSVLDLGTGSGFLQLFLLRVVHRSMRWMFRMRRWTSPSFARN